MGWEEDPHDEFVKFEKRGEENGFWGIEVTISTEGNQQFNKINDRTMNNE